MYLLSGLKYMVKVSKMYIHSFYDDYYYNYWELIVKFNNYPRNDLQISDNFSSTQNKLPKEYIIIRPTLLQIETIIEPFINVMVQWPNICPSACKGIISLLSTCKQFNKFSNFFAQLKENIHSIFWTNCKLCNYNCFTCYNKMLGYCYNCICTLCGKSCNITENNMVVNFKDLKVCSKCDELLKKNERYSYICASKCEYPKYAKDMYRVIDNKKSTEYLNKLIKAEKDNKLLWKQKRNGKYYKDFVQQKNNKWSTKLCKPINQPRK